MKIHLEDETKLSGKVLRYISEGAIVLDKAWTIRYINKLALQLFRKGKTEVLGKNIWKVFPKYKLSESGRRYQLAMQLGKPDHFLTQDIKKQKWFAVDVFPVDASLIIFFRDITTYKNASDTLSKNERRLSALLDKSWSVTTLVDRTGKRLYTTSSIKKVLGFNPRDNIGDDAFTFVHPEDAERVKKIFSESLKYPEKVFTGEYRVKNKQGEYQWLEATLTNMLNDPDIQALVVNYHNITSRRNIEEQLKKSEERFRTLIQQSADAIQLISAEGRIMYSSDSIERVLGYTPQEVQGYTGVPYLHPDDAPKFYKAFSQLLQNPDKTVTLEYRVKHKNGSWIWVEATGKNHLSNPVIGAIVGNFRDITKRKQLEQQKDEFMGMVSHELKTPVTSLKAFAQVLQRQFVEAGDKNAATLLGKMDIQINKLTSLIADLLDATKLDAGKLHFHEKLYSFNKMAEEIIEEVQRTTIQHKISITGKIQKNIFGDRERIGQVLTNLLTNAIKYSPKAKKIIVHFTATRNEIRCCVEDFGIGIAKEKQQKIFERFFRESGFMEDTFPGLGLGLYVSSEIVKRQGGRIWVKSEKGKGSTFCFALPIRKKQ